MKSIKIKTRVFSFLIEGIFYSSIISITLYFYYSSVKGVPNLFSSNLLFFILAIIVFDQYILLKQLGSTLVRLAFNYKFVLKDGNKLTWFSVLKRNLTIHLFEYYSLGVFSLISCLIRKDKRAIHDIFSSTYPIFTNSRKFYKYLIIIVCLIGIPSFSNLILIPIINWKTFPLKASLIESNDFPIYKAQIINDPTKLIRNWILNNTDSIFQDTNNVLLLRDNNLDTIIVSEFRVNIKEETKLIEPFKVCYTLWSEDFILTEFFKNVKPNLSLINVYKNIGIGCSEIINSFYTPLVANAQFKYLFHGENVNYKIFLPDIDSDNSTFWFVKTENYNEIILAIYFKKNKVLAKDFREYFEIIINEGI